MSHWTMPLPGLMRAHVAFANYAAFFAYIDSIKAGSAIGSEWPGDKPNGDILVSSIAEAGDMWGSPWGTHTSADSWYNRIVQHALPSEAVFDQQVSNSASVLCTNLTIPNAPVISVARNGYTSDSWSSTAARRHTRILYWDFSAGRAFEMNPYAMTGPTPLIP